MLMVSLKDHRTILLLSCIVLLSISELVSAEQNRKFNLDKLCRTSPMVRICRGASPSKKNIIEPMFDQFKITKSKRKHFCREHPLHPRCRGVFTAKRDIMDNFNDDYGLPPLEAEVGMDRPNDQILNNPALMGDLLREAVEKASSEYDISEK